MRLDYRMYVFVHTNNVLYKYCCVNRIRLSVVFVALQTLNRSACSFRTPKSLTRTEMGKLTLYYADGGPASRAVVLAVKALNLDVEYV